MNDALEIKRREVAELIANMTPEEKVSMKARMYGFTRVPPDIDTFIEDDMYLGKSTKNGRILFPFWRRFLRELYPTPVSQTHAIIILTGGIGIGKSTVSLILAMYTLLKCLLLRDFSYWDIEALKGVNFVFFHVNVEKAGNDFVFPFYSVYIADSMFFQKNRNNTRFITIAEGPRGNKGIGGDVVFYNLSEINFIPHEKAVEKVNSAISRFYSRWRAAVNVFGHIILDSSVFGDASVVEQVIADNVYPIKVVRAPIWEVKGHTGVYSKEMIRVFTGDSINAPFIIYNEDKAKDLDPDKIIEVPKNLEGEYKADIYKALQESAGISTSLTGRYFTDIDKLNSSFCLPWELESTFVVDFFNEERLMDYFRHMFVNPDGSKKADPIIPYDKLLAIRLDVAYSGDNAGVAVGYLRDLKCINKEIDLFEPLIDIPIQFGVNRRAGQETAITKLKEFILDLGQWYEIGVVTTDQFQSRQIVQDLTREGIRAYFMSMDRNTKAYDLHKIMIYESRLRQAKNLLSMEEQNQLRRMGNKIDHLPNGSKDISDATGGIAQSIVDNLEIFKQVSQRYSMEKSQEIFKEFMRGSQHQRDFEDKLINLF